MRRTTLHFRKLLLFTLLSLTDLYLTWLLLHHGRGQVYETNPIASALLGSFGWMGVVVFKILMVLMVGSLCILISLYRPHTSGRILLFACSTTALVVLYSVSLLGYAGVPWPQP